MALNFHLHYPRFVFPNFSNCQKSAIASTEMWLISFGAKMLTLMTLKLNVFEGNEAIVLEVEGRDYQLMWPAVRNRH